MPNSCSIVPEPHIQIFIKGLSICETSNWRQNGLQLMVFRQESQTQELNLNGCINYVKDISKHENCYDQSKKRNR